MSAQTEGSRGKDRFYRKTPPIQARQAPLRSSLFAAEPISTVARSVLFAAPLGYAAMAVDMETFAVAEVCRRRDVPFSSVRVINDTADEALPPDVEHLLVQKSGAAQWGAAVGAIWRRPVLAG